MQRLEILRQKVQSLYQTNNPGADRWIDWAYQNHVSVVAKLGEGLAKKHAANVELVVAGALLHDIADVIMARKRPEHEVESLKLAEQILLESGYDETETNVVVNEIIKPHGCNELMPETLEGKVVATADGMAHFATDFYPYFCWKHYAPDDDYQKFKAWVLRKIEKDFNKKLFFDEVRDEIRPKYEALKLIFS